jgi:hypothetical protein
MPVNKKTVLAALSVLILCFAIAQQVQAQDTTEYQVGVSEGDTFKYDLSFYWSSTDPNATAPASWADANATDYYQVTIQRVSGTTVEMDTVWSFLNGTEISGTEIAEVASGLGESILVYAANLSAGEQLYPRSSDITDKIGETVALSYSQGSRETNHVEVTKTDVENEVLNYLDLYFDKQTGMMVEVYTDVVYTNLPDQTFSRMAKIKESSLWDASGFSLDRNSDHNIQPPTQSPPMELVYVIISAVVIVTVAASLLLLRKRKPKKRQFPRRRRKSSK